LSCFGEEDKRDMSASTKLGWLLAFLGSCASRGLAAEPPAAAVVINEIRTAGGDWIELYNSGAAGTDLSDWKLADSGTGGEARLKSAVKFPRGTVIPAGGYFLVVSDGGKKNAAATRRVCSSRPAAPCLTATWRLDKNKSETLRLFTADDTLAAEASVPAGAVPKGRTWARQPDGFGDFAVAEPTPGRPNLRKGGK
jgi:hypothetical protein